MNSIEILVLDFGSQYTQLITRRLREFGVYAEIAPYFEKIDSIRNKNPKGIILSGGPSSIYDKDSPKPDSRIFELGIPILGICYGMQYIADFFGGKVIKSNAHEYGKAKLEIITKSLPPSPLQQNYFIFMKAQKEDLQEILDLQHIAFKDEAKRIGNFNIEPLTQDLESIMQEYQNNIFMKCSINGKIIGSVRGYKKEDTTYINKLFVDNDFRKQGIGKKLIIKLQELLPAKRFEIFTSIKSPENVSRYEKLGFKRFKNEELDYGVEMIFLEKYQDSYDSNSKNDSNFHFIVKSDPLFNSIKEEMIILWEDSVSQTHTFLAQKDILLEEKEFLVALESLENIIVAVKDNKPIGFIVVQNNFIELLFVKPNSFKQGVGKALVYEAYRRYLNKYDVIELECNEQNPNAFDFYWHIGFRILKRSPKDFADRDFPILRLQISNQNLKLNILSTLLFNNVKQRSTIWMSHADKVEVLPDNFIELARSDNTHYCAIANYEKKIYALQFHPEVVHSEYGVEILKNFAVEICNSGRDWNMRNFADLEIAKLKEIIKEGKVICAVSGGVDSSVVATLLHRAINDRLIPVFVDTGLLRAGEKESVEAMFKENLKVPLISIDASELFLSRLKGVVEPEKKRKIIGESFIEVFETEAKKHNINGEIKFLAQGTLYPDVIESVSVKGPSKVIKSHHNVGGLPESMKFSLIEPLRELFKDEVRALGKELGMPSSMLMRHPFPGPGLAIRILGEVNKADLELLRKADLIFIEELQDKGFYNKTWQAFCVLLNVRSVGVMGDNRTYDNTICIRAVEAIDGMTATFAHLPHDFLENVANRIINEVGGINRAVYDITSKPPGTIEWE